MVFKAKFTFLSKRKLIKETIMKTMFLKASTNNVGSECETDMEITKEDWDKLTEKEQAYLIGEYQADIVEIWVE